ncbi:MAG: sulfurtransferase TusA family protein [Pseudomonadota bacterium]|nr:sulfurtransferase TusA family protein [Pseudomonadota bacterium]
MTERTKIDARGAYCPGPLMELIAGLKLIELGDEIEVLSSDKGSLTDIPVWVDKAGHNLEKVTELEKYSSIVVRKAR